MEFLNEIEIDDEVKSQLASKVQEEIQRKIDLEVSGLKSKNDELIAERIKWQEEREKVAQAAKREAEEKAKSENDYKQLFESQKAEADQLRSVIDRMNQDISRQQINGEASKIAATLTKDVNKAKLLQQQISSRLTLVDNEIRVTDEGGQLTVSSLDDLTQSIKNNYPFLVDGSQAQGGGAVRAQGRAEARNKELTRAEFEGLSHAERQQFFENGGKLYDE